MDVVPVFPLAVGVSIREALITVAPVFSALRLKWPNDILFEKRKGGGSIIESSSDFFFIGIGLNLQVAPIVLDGGRAACCLSELLPTIEPRPVAQAICTQIAKIAAHSSDPTFVRGRIVEAFKESMEWDIELFKRTPDGRDGRPLRPVRLTEWGQLIVSPADGTGEEETLTAEYLF